jgi:CheY-like chemotaxis protein
MVTIRDVAKIAGVSRSTVSLVLNNSPLVKERTRKKVLETITKTDYVPNNSARSLSSRMMYSLGLIVMVEDVEVNREIVIALLEELRIDIDCAENGRQAFEMFAADPGRYDIIFMDVQMPVMDGYEATRLIRKLDAAEAKNIPIIALTANVFQEDVKKALDAGMNGHLGKPLNRGEIIAVLADRLLS